MKRMTEKPNFPPNAALIISLVAVSTASILIRMSSAPPLTIATYRLLFTTAILFPFYLRSGGLKKLVSSPSIDILILTVVGLVLAIHFASWITSLSLTSVASSVTLVHVDQIFVATISHFIFKERINIRTILGIIIAFIGATIIALGDFGVGENNLFGDFLALVGAIMLGIYILSGRKLRQELDLISYVTPVYATSTLFLILFSIVSGVSLAPYPLREYLLFLIIAIVPMIFGHTIYNWALKYVQAPVISISLLGEPVGATLLAFVFLKETPSIFTLMGGAITLIGIYQCVRSRN
jgi:drug/metabolite transporter (DMT)-like permease